MDRRAFLGILTGSVLATPIIVEAQQEGRSLGSESSFQWNPRRRPSPTSPRSVRGCAASATFKDRTSRSTTAML